MARGWESKSVEAQQEEAAKATSSLKPRLSREEASRLRKRETLRLARQRVVDQIKTNQNPLRAQMLAAALREIEAKLESL